ncbi:Golgi-associated plant pathogenesis-related protein 1-like [Ornithodoros turicata]|uniref:Golgi-associated plant pathogenesis-related protein 1-like n=1 Tax=Ornithodoros turicata TaxID=34597 RepID=UPI003139B4E5
MFKTGGDRMLTSVFFSRPLKIRQEANEGLADFGQSDFVLDCLEWHNRFRIHHRAPPLRLSYKLCNLAQYWANHLAHTNDFHYKKFEGLGENLFCRWSYVPNFDVTGEQVAKYWYSYVKYYNFYQEPSLLHVQAGHFSQMVWLRSTDFGVGRASTRQGKIIAVAMYKPAGNIIGEFHHNVLPPILPDSSDDGSVTAPYGLVPPSPRRPLNRMTCPAQGSPEEPM